MTFTSIDDNGFHFATDSLGNTGLPAWLEYFTSSYQGIYGTTADLSPSSPDGQWIAFLAQNNVDMEQLLYTVYIGRSPAGAVGQGLSRLVLLNGIRRLAAQYSVAPITMFGTNGTVIPIGSRIASLSDPTIPAFVAMAQYTIGGGGTVNGQAICTTPGPVNVANADLSVIKTQVAGWTAVTNTSPASPGILIETDPVLRTRRAGSVALPSQSLVDGLFAALSNLTGVQPGGVAVYENPTGAPDANGLPEHSVRAIVAGGDPQEIGNAIRVKKSLGATTVGAQKVVVTDAQGVAYTMSYDVPTSLNVYVGVQLSIPSDQPQVLDPALIAAIQKALWTYGQSVSAVGKNINWADIFTPVNALGLTGGTGQPSIVAIYLGSSPAPTLQEDLVVAIDALPYFGAAPTVQVSVSLV